MFTLLPIACWGAIFLVCAKHGMSRRSAFLAAAIIWGVLLTVITESLSLMAALSREWIAASWGGAAIIAVTFLFLAAPKERQPPHAPLTRTDIVFSGGIAFICLATLATALLAPPNNWDSMTYHMSRVVHWLQNRSVAHYPTHILRQLELNPWSEFAIAHFQALSRGDRFANLVQWFSMIGSIIGATLVAGELGAQHRGQLLAAALTASIPMGILQSSSSQNDYVTAFWLLCFVWSGIRLRKEKKTWWGLMAGASLGLALLTKGTAYLYALPFVLWVFWEIMRGARQRALPLLLCVTLPVLLLNGGHYQRNWSLFSNPLASSTNAFTNDAITAVTLLSNLARNGAMHLSTPYEEVNQNLEKGIAAFHDVIGIGINDKRTTWPGASFGVPRFMLHEDYSGNLLHAVLAVLTLGLLFCRKSIRRASAEIMPYVLGVTGGFFLFCLLLKWQPWHVRLHLPLFVLGAPAMGMVLGQLRRQGPVLAVTALVLAASVPWVLGNATRPLTPSPSAIIDHFVRGKPLPLTIITADRSQQYFTNRPALWRPYSVITSLIKKSGAGNIGLHLNGEDWEYPLWVLLDDADGSGPRIEHVEVRNRSGTIGLVNFHPDLIVQFDVQGYPVLTGPQGRGFD